MKFLFFFVHPSKFHVFRHTVNALKAHGHQVDIIITYKDVLQALVNNEGWDHINIFPRGRKIKGLNPKISAIINTLRTLYRLNKIVSKKKYDLFITDDLLTITGRLKNIPSILFQDDDISAVPESFLVLSTANYILAPDFTDFKKYNFKKIGFYGFKASAYLHPNHFRPNNEILDIYDIKNKKIFIIRLVSLTATHDIGKRGLDDKDIDRIIQKLIPYGEVIISSQRSLPERYEKYRKNIAPEHFIHVMAYAELFISDSQTMSMESGYLGTPYIRFNDFIGKISYLNVLEEKYNLGIGILTRNKDLLFDKIDEILDNSNFKSQYLVRRNKMLNETIDLTKYMIWLFENFPESIQTLNNNPNYQKRFK